VRVNELHFRPDADSLFSAYLMFSIALIGAAIGLSTVVFTGRGADWLIAQSVLVSAWLLRALLALERTDYRLNAVNFRMGRFWPSRTIPLNAIDTVRIGPAGRFIRSAPRLLVAFDGRARSVELSLESPNRFIAELAARAPHLAIDGDRLVRQP
jgi:hypothetical protein